MKPIRYIAAALILQERLNTGHTLQRLINQQKSWALCSNFRNSRENHAWPNQDYNYVFETIYRIRRLASKTKTNEPSVSWEPSVSVYTLLSLEFVEKKRVKICA